MSKKTKESIEKQIRDSIEKQTFPILKIGEREALKQVIEIAKQYGYGNVISLVQRCWIERLKESGLREEDGLCHVKNHIYPYSEEMMGAIINEREGGINQSETVISVYEPLKEKVKTARKNVLISYIDDVSPNLMKLMDFTKTSEPPHDTLFVKAGSGNRGITSVKYGKQIFTLDPGETFVTHGVNRRDRVFEVSIGVEYDGDTVAVG